MRKFLIFVGYLAAVATGYFAIDICAGKMFDTFLFLNNSPKMKRACSESRHEDVAILGASRAAHHYNPAILAESLNVDCYNYGMDGRNIFNQYVVAKELLHNPSNRPGVILLEIAGIDLADQPGYNGEKLSNLNVLYKQNGNVKEIIDKENPTSGKVLGIVNLYRYNSDLLSYMRTSVLGDDSGNGYAPLYGKWAKDAEEAQYVNPKLYPAKEVYFRKLIENCKSCGTRVIVYNSPEYYVDRPMAPWELKVEAICKEYNVAFVNHSRDTLFMNHREWFNEPFHLNDEGAKVYTSIVAKELKPYINN